LRQQPLFMAAALYLLVAGLLTFSEKWPGAHTALVQMLHLELLYPISKTDLAPARLLHFLALVYVASRLLPSHHGWLDNWPARQTCRMGRYSLEIFCLGVLLAPLADMANALAGDTWPMQVTTALAGLGLMALMANGLELNKKLGKPIQAVAT
jgi:hypothetical protein